MSGPDIETTLRWMLENADRSPSAEVVIVRNGEPQRYRMSIWRNGTIALRPI